MQTGDSNKLSYYIFYPLLFVFTIWLVYWIEETFHLNFTQYGIYPRKLTGLLGILFSPFIHGDFFHILHNSLPLFILLSFLFYHYRHIAWKILFWGWVMTGVGTWLLGRASYHIGISGINYMLVSFLFFSGVIIGYYRLMALSLIIVFLYGSLIWLMFPLVEKISWEGHLSGFLSGLILAIIYGKKLKIHYDSEKTVKIYPQDEDFLKHFDENGNFIENIEQNSKNDETKEP
jgi:membrane associated rhomboid family serine protease